MPIWFAYQSVIFTCPGHLQMSGSSHLEYRAFKIKSSLFYLPTASLTWSGLNLFPEPLFISLSACDMISVKSLAFLFSIVDDLTVTLTYIMFELLSWKDNGFLCWMVDSERLKLVYFKRLWVVDPPPALTATSLIHKLIALNYHRRILFTEIFS